MKRSCLCMCVSVSLKTTRKNFNFFNVFYRKFCTLVVFRPKVRKGYATSVLGVWWIIEVSAMTPSKREINRIKSARYLDTTTTVRGDISIRLHSTRGDDRRDLGEISRSDPARWGRYLEGTFRWRGPDRHRDQRPTKCERKIVEGALKKKASITQAE